MTPIDPTMHYILLAVGVLGSVAAYTAASRMFAPPAESEDGDLSKLAKKEVGTSSAFSSLNPQGTLLEKLDLLDEMHAQLGVRQFPVPLSPEQVLAGEAEGKGKISKAPPLFPRK